MIPDRPLRVLYIHGVGPFGGSSRSLFEAVRGFEPGTVDPFFIAASGTATTFFREVAVDLIETRGLSRFDNTRYSFYRGVRWIVVLRELFHVPFMLAALLKAKRRWKSVDVIHANEITEIFSMMLARWLFAAPTVVHVRSMQRPDESVWRNRWLRNRLRRVSAVVAIDENVRSTLPLDVAVEVIHNAFTPKVAAEPDPQLVSRIQALSKTSLKVGFVGNLHHGKGLEDLLEASAIVIGQGKDVEFVLVGGETASGDGLQGAILRRLGLRQNIKTSLKEQVAERGLAHAYHFLGATNDIQRAYEAMDVLCFPSHFEATGRPVFEAAFSGVPSIAALNDPRPDTLAHGETGLAVPQKDPEKLAAAIAFLADNRSEVARMGANALALAHRNFDPATNSRRLLGLYRRLVGAGREPTS